MDAPYSMGRLQPTTAQLRDEIKGVGAKADELMTIAQALQQVSDSRASMASASQDLLQVVAGTLDETRAEVGAIAGQIASLAATVAGVGDAVTAVIESLKVINARLGPAPDPGMVPVGTMKLTDTQKAALGEVLKDAAIMVVPPSG